MKPGHKGKAKAVDTGPIEVRVEDFDQRFRTDAKAIEIQDTISKVAYDSESNSSYVFGGQDGHASSKRESRNSGICSVQ